MESITLKTAMSQVDVSIREICYSRVLAILRVPECIVGLYVSGRDARGDRTNTNSRLGLYEQQWQRSYDPVIFQSAVSFCNSTTFLTLFPAVSQQVRKLH